ncbi:hypothetical protein [Periweissella fabalis]|uniref:Uncharacterized protein n=1 Tax=Periweissella fabalis TaxID=1070421 RepID=A0A7X6N3R3_9LACO|nr:hypothetical protein [Periweissella fabalis]MCM0598087.1 hypothetical protein [Periweissella fabalis]NKZ24789.1 hypothetical protein [Periweissella fabalis]
MNTPNINVNGLRTKPTANGYPKGLNLNLTNENLVLATDFVYQRPDNSDKYPDLYYVKPQATLSLDVKDLKPTVNSRTWNSDGSYTITGSLAQKGDTITANLNGGTFTPQTDSNTGNWTLTIPTATATNTVTFTESDSNLVAANSGATNDPAGTAIAEIGPKPLAFHTNDGTWQPIKFYQADGTNSNIPKDNQTFDLGKVQKNYVYGSTWNAFLDNYTAGKNFSITATSAGLTLAGHQTVPLYYTNGNYSNTNPSNNKNFLQLLTNNTPTKIMSWNDATVNLTLSNTP